MLARGNIRREPADVRTRSVWTEPDDRNLFQPDLGTIRPPIAERDRKRRLVGSRAFEAGGHPRPVFRMDVFQPFSPAERLLRVETEDVGRILAEPNFVGRHVPIEGYDAAGPQRLLQPGLPFQNETFVQSSLTEQG